MPDLKSIERAALQRANEAPHLDAVAKLRAEILGKKGELGVVLRGLKDLPPDDRRKMGQAINALKERIDTALRARVAVLEGARREVELERGRFDVTLPGRRVQPGAPHPLRRTERDIVRSFEQVGFTVAAGPLVEHDWYNFGALNIPEDHPSRDMQDTFFVSPEVVLRTHTSNVQIRTMVAQPPPVRLVAPGMVFRNDEVDATHSPVFHQVEGLWVDDRATFANLKGVLQKFALDMFGPGTEVRFRPSFFPFTEPSAEMDVRWPGTDRWIEVLGSGMVDPAVLDAVGYDPDAVQGFAFGIGIERVAMLRWGVDDIRLFYENDWRFLRQFSGGVGTWK